MAGRKRKVSGREKARRKRLSQVHGCEYYKTRIRDKLTLVEEYEYIKKIRAGTITDEEKEAFIMANMHNIMHAATQVYERAGRRVPIEDLIQVGIMGLMVAVSNKAKSGPRKGQYLFDMRKCYRVSTYCMSWVRKYCIHEVERSNVITVPPLLIYRVKKKLDNDEPIVDREILAKNALYEKQSIDLETEGDDSTFANNILDREAAKDKTDYELVLEALRGIGDSPEHIAIAEKIKNSPVYDIYVLDESYKETMRKHGLKTKQEYYEFKEEIFKKLLTELDL